MSHVVQVRKDGLAETPWLTRERVLVLVLLVVTTLAIVLCWCLIRPFVSVLAWALALGIVARPLHSAIARRVRHPDAAAGLAVALVAVLIVFPVIFVAYHLVQEASTGAQHMQEEALNGGWRERIESIPWLGEAVHWGLENLNVRAGFQQIVESLTANVPIVVAGTLWVAVQLLLVLFTLFFFFRDRHEVLDILRSLLPLSDNEIHEVFTNVADTIHATVYGSLLVALIQGTMGGFMFWLLGLPAPLLWGIVMSVLAVVPNLGTFVVWGPTAVLLALGGDWGKALILTLWGGVAIALIDNLLYPYLVGQRMRLHTLAVFFSLLGGVILLGAAGVVLGPVILVITLALVDVWRRRFRGGQPAEAAIQKSPPAVTGGLLPRANETTVISK